MLAVIFLVFLVSLFLGVPVALCLAFTSVAGLLLHDTSLLVVVQRMFQGFNSFSLLAVPFFVLAGDLMNKCGITQRLIDFSYMLVGRIPGGLAHSNIAASMFLGGISGSAVADAAAIGSIMVPGMIRNGYNPGFSAAVTAAASTMGPIIPPSILMVIMGVTTGMSIGGLFMAGIVPGILLGVGMMIYSYFVAIRENYPRDPNPLTLGRFFREFWRALPALMAPTIIMGGIMFGIFTSTEAAAVAVLYALLLGICQRTLRMKDLIEVLGSSVLTTAVLLLIIGTANAFAWLLAAEQIPNQLAALIQSVTSNKLIILLLLNILLLFVGMFMEGGAAIIILAPTLLNVATQVGIEPLHFGMIMVLNMAVGLLTPPLGVCLFVICGVTKLDLSYVIRAVLPFIAVELGVLLLVTYVPAVCLAIPRMLGYL
ncbi:TRAP transporter large permease [Mailhella massiliensis]|uniref:TRAP transporter large permease n=1 Tax=Mailhella massiliensis TaxID=1903261 RepID=A0A921DTB3_9BACT|nr:TRAP transporter large permease [Mailhella massiliensis]HJD97907.1 TRAP transporter large permease [Mailhella massiliensis]